MPVFRINKNKDYTTMSNIHLKDKRISLKAKGLLSEMLSLPDDWNYSIKGLVSLNKEQETSIKATLKELQNFKYLIVTKQLPNETNSGKIEYIYDIFESPKQAAGNLPLDFLPLENLPLENRRLYNTNNKRLNNKILNNKNNIFKKPTIDQVQQYCQQRNNNIDAQSFIDFYESKDWMIGKNKMKNWQACIRTWERRNNNTQQSLPKWFDKQIDKQQMTDQEKQQLEQLINNF